MRKFSQIFPVLIFYLLSLIVHQNVYSQSEGTVSTELIIINCDRDVYIAGEELVFSLNLINGKVNVGNSSHIAYVVLRNEAQNVVLHISTIIENGIGWSSIYLPDTLSTGYYQLVAFTNFMRNFGEDAYATKQLIVANRFDNYFSNLHRDGGESDSSKRSLSDKSNSLVSIELNKGAFAIHEKVKLTVKPNSTSSISNFSISIVPKYAVCNDVDKGIIRETHIETIQFDQSKELYLKEVDGIYLSGSILDGISGKAIEGARLFLSTPDSLVNLKYTHSNALGRFHFHLPHIFQGRKVFVIPDTSTFIGDPKVILENKIELKRPFQPKIVKITDELIDYLKYSQSIVRIQKSYNLKYFSFEPLNMVANQGLPRVFSDPKFRIKLSEYESLNDFQEISRELIPYIRVRRRGNDYSVRMLNGQSSYTFFSSSPAIFLNGVPIGSIDKIKGYGSKELERIEIVNLPWRYGELLFSGILTVFLKPDIPIEPHLPSFTAIHHLDLLADHAVYKPQFNSNEEVTISAKPDFRQVLYWNPCSKANSNEPFEDVLYTGHLYGEYIVVVTGITDEGQCFSEVKLFEVKKIN
jgi:hypothetical protein